MKIDVLVEVGLALLAGGFLILGFGAGADDVREFDLAQRTPDSVRVMTWNVGGRAGEGGHALSDELLDHVAALIEEVGPDLCFLQEVEDYAQLERLLTRLQGPWRWMISRAGGRRVAALAPSGEFRPVRSAELAQRSLALELTLPTGTTLLALGLHAHAWSSEERNREIGGAVNVLLDAGRGLPRLLLGDLNLDLDLDKRRDLFSDDAYRDVETYNFVADRLVDAAGGTGPTAEPDRRLDYVFVSPDLISVQQAGPLRDRRAADMDHDPVLADLTIN